MGNHDIRTITFRQSLTDFPLTVDLGREVPDWGLTRWGKAGVVPSLRFRPPADEAFSLRGDRRQLLYKGRKQSHRFTILGHDKFEYDCILNQEPESNVVCMEMDGAENYDFFRQPDFVKDPFLAVSYAVYKKETLIGEGTGKLCHIHRPRISDARRRWVWGDLAIIGDRLNITIPERWLADAAYPVIVDPVVGTATVGSQTFWDSDPPEPWVPLCFDSEIPVNRFLLGDGINGLCTAKFYTYEDHDPYEGGHPVLYSDNGNTPLTRRSADEQFIDLTINTTKPAGWRSGTFRSDGAIAGGSYIWFGLSACYMWWSCFDYGSKCFSWPWDGELFPNVYPQPQQVMFSFEDFKLSMYFEYTAVQSYTRTLTQGVKLADTRKVTAVYKKTLLTVLKTSDTNKTLITLIRKIAGRVSALDSTGHLGDYFRGLYADAGSIAETGHIAAYYRKQEDTAYTEAIPLRSLFMAVRLVTVGLVRDFILKRFLKSNEDMVLKSAVCRDIEIDSRIH
jgi:hypothetical protein